MTILSTREIAYKTYQLTSQRIEVDSVNTKTYGITICCGGERESIQDISSNFESVLRMYDLICNGELNPVHLIDVVEDFLSSHDVISVDEINKCLIS